MLSRAKLPLTFDAAGLKSDLDRIPPAEWVRHFNERCYEGDWSGVALRAVQGEAGRIYPDPTMSQLLVDTPVLAKCESLRRALTSIECPLKSARLLKLGAGARILEHRDYNLSLEDGEIRLHIPITTSPEVEFHLNGERVFMQEGECWYINANLPHKVWNRGSLERVHLVLDCVVDDWLRAIMADASERIEIPIMDFREEASSPEELKRFRELVLEDPSLQDRLRDVNDKGLFIDLVVALGKERGYSFSRTDVSDELTAKRREWRERWV